MNVGFKFFNYTIVVITATLLSSWTIYTEKRSEALSQAVFATAESIHNARFDKAGEYSEQAKRLAYRPKKLITVPPIITKKTPTFRGSVEAPSSLRVVPSTKQQTGNVTVAEDEQILRLVVPEHLKHAKLLIENSEEWNELLKTKKFKEQLETDNANLKKLASDIDAELSRQQAYNNKMVTDLNIMQKKLVENDLLILRLYIAIGVLISSIAGGIYLRIKGILWKTH